MRLNTSSGVITFAGQLEEKSAVIYENLAAAYPAGAEYFLGLARENRKNKVQIERSYYGVITDAIEGSFTFEMDVDEYVLDPGLPATADYQDALAKAGGMEDKIIRFYREAAQQSKALLADIPRVFALVAKKREARLTGLKKLGEVSG